jgi:hypothetical protein
MFGCKGFSLLFLLFVLGVQVSGFDLQFFTTEKDTVYLKSTQDEIILFNMINDMRRQNKLQPIPLSDDLCIVAHTHIDDLIKWKPQDNGCSLHSWSSSGKWTACCNSKDPAGIQCMKLKPKEITGYPGSGYELIFWGEDNATPADAADLWRQVDASADMILSRGKWKGYLWKALGVGLKEGYAVLWLGDKTDTKSQVVPETTPSVVAQQQSPKEIIPAKPPVKEVVAVNKVPEVRQKEPVVSEGNTRQDNAGVKFYLVVSSVKTSDAAKSELKKIKARGYPDAIILEGESIFRIALSSYDSSTKASVRKNELKDEFPGIWVYKK